MELEEKVRAYKGLARQIEHLDEQKKALGKEILQLMAPETTILEVAEYKVRRMVQFSIKTPLESARSFGAVKEVVDKDKIKKLVLQGLAIEGVSAYEFIQVSMLKNLKLEEQHS